METDLDQIVIKYIVNFSFRIEQDLVAKAVLSKEITHDINFDDHPLANPASRQNGQLRFQFNPTPHWGPGCRAAVK